MLQKISYLFCLQRIEYQKKVLNPSVSQFENNKAHGRTLTLCRVCDIISVMKVKQSKFNSFIKDIDLQDLNFTQSTIIGTVFVATVTFGQLMAFWLRI